MAHDLTKDVIGVKEFEVQKINQSGEPAEFSGSITQDAHIVNKKYVDDKKVESFPTDLTSGSVVFSDGTNLAQNNSKLFWDEVNERLGIGTTTPVRLLDISGDSPQLRLTNGAEFVDLSLRDTGYFSINPSGKFVGIRTNTPEGLFHVYNTASGGAAAIDGSDLMILENNTHTYFNMKTPANAIGGFLFSDNIRGDGYIYYDHRVPAFRFGVGTSEKMRLTSTGVGIGTTTPTLGKVHIVGGDSISTGLTVEDAAKTGVGIRWWYDAVNIAARISMGGSEGGNILLNGAGPGSVGIGTIDPDLGSLHVVQRHDTVLDGIAIETSAQTGLAFRLWTDGDGKGRLQGGGSGNGDILLNGVGSGKIGIGTSVPEAALHVKGGSVNEVLHLESSLGPAIILEDTTENHFWSMNTGGPGPDLYINYDSVTGGTVMFLGNDGKIGIGTTSPDTKLQVVGDCKFGDDNTNYASFDSDGELTLTGTAKVTKSKTFLFNYSRITGKGKPTLVNQGVFFGWSLPIYSSDDEELFTCSCIPTDWDGVSDPVFCVAGWLDTANTDKKFKLQCSVNTYDPTTNEVVPSTTVDYTTETTTGTDAQYTSFIVCFTLDASAAGLTAGKSVGIRIRRVAATTAEIAGEFVVEGAVVTYVSDKLGEAT